jgi:hypothetical protein
MLTVLRTFKAVSTIKIAKLFNGNCLNHLFPSLSDFYLYHLNILKIKISEVLEIVFQLNKEKENCNLNINFIAAEISSIQNPMKTHFAFLQKNVKKRPISILLLITVNKPFWGMD